MTGEAKVTGSGLLRVLLDVSSRRFVVFCSALRCCSQILPWASSPGPAFPQIAIPARHSGAEHGWILVRGCRWIPCCACCIVFPSSRLVSLSGTLLALYRKVDAHPWTVLACGPLGGDKEFVGAENKAGMSKTRLKEDLDIRRHRKGSVHQTVCPMDRLPG